MQRDVVLPQDVAFPQDVVVAFPRNIVVFTEPKQLGEFHSVKLFVTASSELYAARANLGSSKQFVSKNDGWANSQKLL